MPAFARELEQALERRADLSHLRLGRPAAAHRHDDHVAVERQQPREVPRDRGLAHALARAHDRQRREGKRRQLGRVEAKVRPHVRQAVSQHPARHPEALARAEHRLVGEIDHELRLELCDRGL